MDVVLTAALITAYLAGVAALLAPCCIGVLLPAYFGSVFRQRRTVLLMTVVFSFGLLTVFLPLGLGMGYLGKLFKDYHNGIYLSASIFFIILAAIILLGVHISLPFRTKSQVKLTGGVPVFILGIFSGFATLCCAPVLAGAMALSALPGSTLWGGVYSIVYVVGMVSPLFIISYYLDKKGVMERVNSLKREVRYSLLGRKISITIANIFSGAIFLIMGILLLYYSLTDQITMGDSDASLWLNIMISTLTDKVTQFLTSASGQLIFLGIVAVLFGWIIWAIKTKRREDRP